MPRKPPDLSDQIDAIVREAAERILAVVAEQQDRWLEALEHQLETAETTLRERRRLSRSIRDAIAEAETPHPSPGSASSQRRVRTEDAVTDLREILAIHRSGLRIGELREITGYSDMQLHRALGRLVEAGEATRAGAQRKTVYRPTRRLKSASAPKANPPSAQDRRRSTRRTRRRSPRDQWVSTDDVKTAIVKALRNRRAGLAMAELCERTGYTDKQLHRAITALVDAGRLTKSGHHRAMRYQLKTRRPRS